MKSIYIILFGLITLSGCQTPPEQPDVPIDIGHRQMQHGWTIFTGPKRTLLGVNDLNSIRRGQKVYKKHCASCHGLSGQGDGFVAKEFGIRPANLSALAGQTPNHYLVVRINEGVGSMPKWRDLLSPQETWDVSNYIQSLRNK